MGLTVIFPDGEIVFGDIAVGASTAYKVVPNGVYGYAAYRYRVEQVEFTQPVIDWVGEAPLGRARFTYKLDFDSDRTAREAIHLVEVTNDASASGLPND